MLTECVTKRGISMRKLIVVVIVVFGIIAVIKFMPESQRRVDCVWIDAPDPELEPLGRCVQP